MRALCVSMLLAGVVGCAGGDENAAGADSGGGLCSFCAEGQECCDGACVNTFNSAQNCGECGNACSLPAEDSCSSGFCVCNNNLPCSEGEFCCEDGCANLMTDPANCGDCGRACGPNETCTGGDCVCAGTGSSCALGEKCCSTGCVNTATSPQHCGECEATCGTGSAVTCEAGECACSAECPAGTLVEGCCGDSCFNLCSDTSNCGTCGHVCTAGESCELGVCGDEFMLPNFACIELPF